MSWALCEFLSPVVARGLDDSVGSFYVGVWSRGVPYGSAGRFRFRNINAT